MSDLEQLSYEDAWAYIGELATDLLNHHDPKVTERVQELLDWVDAVHREGLSRLVEMIRAWRGDLFLESVARDEVTGALLSAYGLGEGESVLKEQARLAVEDALEEIRPYAESHGGSIELESIAEGVVTVRMLGSCDGCPSSSATLTHGVEDALRKHWADFRRLELIDPPAETETLAAAAPAPQQLLQIRGHEGK